MKSSFIIIIILLLFVSCGSLKNTAKTVDTAGRLSINFRSESNVINLNGLINITKDSSFFNLFGPLGINVAKILVIGDTINIVDIQNRKIYKSHFLNLSKSVFNIFIGKFTSSEEQLMRALCYFIDSDTWKSINNSKDLNNSPEFDYNFEGSKKKEIRIAINGKKTNYLLKMKYSSVASNKTKSFDLSRYLNFETFSIKLQ